MFSESLLTYIILSQLSEEADIPDAELEVSIIYLFCGCCGCCGCCCCCCCCCCVGLWRFKICLSLTGFPKGFTWKPSKQKRLGHVLFQPMLLFVKCGIIQNIDASSVCLQKERFIQVSKVDDEERKRREQQKLEKEQVSLSSGWISVLKCLIVSLRMLCFDSNSFTSPSPTGGAKWCCWLLQGRPRHLKICELTSVFFNPNFYFQGQL